jgi:hypothetical protein
MNHRYVIALVTCTLTALCACGASDEAPPEEEATASEAVVGLTKFNAEWCIKHTYGYRYLSHAVPTPYDWWDFEVDNYYGRSEGKAHAWLDHRCPHSVGVRANAYGVSHPPRCCAQ